jgi:hypothetical protein
VMREGENLVSKRGCYRSGDPAVIPQRAERQPEHALRNGRSACRRPRAIADGLDQRIAPAEVAAEVLDALGGQNMRMRIFMPATPSLPSRRQNDPIVADEALPPAAVEELVKLGPR